VPAQSAPGTCPQKKTWYENLVQYPEMEFLDLKFDKRFASFDPCYSQSLVLDVKENHNLFWLLKNTYELNYIQNEEN
jgi:hypothetical protein